MRILYLGSIPFDGPFGDSVRVRELVSNLASKNEVAVIAPTLANSSYGPIGISGFRKLRKLGLKRFGQVSATIGSLVSLMNSGGAKNYDIIFETFSGLVGAASIEKKLHRLPVVVELHGLIDKEEQTYNLPWVYTRVIHPMLIRRTLRLADGIVTVTEGIKKEISETYGIEEEKIKVVPNGVNTSLFKPMDQSKMRRDLNLDEEGIYIGFVGNLAPWQGIEHLIETAPGIVEKCKDKVKFIIVGDGIMKERLQRMVKELGLSGRFIFTGKVNYEDVPRYINSFDVCVAPFKSNASSLQFGASPLKIFDYMACGKAIVASDIPGVADLLLSARAGVVVSPTNCNQFACAVVELINNVEFCQTLGKNGLAEVRNNHDWKIKARELNLFLKEIARKSKRFD